ncbi:MAG TPA: AsmA family protein [Pseudolabrys sp.]|nr:AsmA family protein [Pseudolabrys sp.]
MQTTLLGIAIAIIVALVAALTAPLLIDWGGYRSLFEAEASRLVGVDVNVRGPIDARLLPSPQITLHNIEIGDSGAGKVHARSLDIEFALAPLMRGEWRATNLHLDGPQVHLHVDGAGRMQAPKLSIGFRPGALAIDRLAVTGGKIVIANAASGDTVTLDHVYFNGDATSLAGPFKGEGAVSFEGDSFPFRISTGSYGGGGIKLHLKIDPRDHPMAVEADGTLSLAGGKPDFEGTLTVRRLVGVNGSKVEQPWSVTGKLKATAASALLQDATLQYGAEDKGVTLTGVADLRLGKTPRFKAELSGRQLDLDRLINGDGQPSTPGAAVRKLAGVAFRPPIPMQIGIGIDQVTFAGSALQNVRGDIIADDSGWNLNELEFRAPGYTQAKLSGRLVAENNSLTFTGPAEIDSTNPKALTAWLEGRAQPDDNELRPLSVRGKLTLGSKKIAIENLTAKFAGKTVTGRFAYLFAAGKQPSRLDAALNAPELDLDLAIAFGKALYSGAHLARPHDMNITADIGRATLGGIEGHGVSAHVKVDADHWQVDRLSVADLGGASFSAGGHLSFTGASPQGRLRVDFGASDPKPILTLLSRFAPEAAKRLARGAQAMVPAKLHAQLAIEGAAPGEANLGVDGSFGKVKVALSGKAQVNPKEFSVGDLNFDGKFSTDDGKALLALLDLDRFVAVGDGPATMAIDAKGPAQGQWRVNGRLSAKGLDAHASGTAQPFADSPSLDVHTTIAQANIAPLRRTGGAGALPVRFSGRVALDAGKLTLSGVEASVAGANLSGRVAVSLDRPHRLQGELDADSIDGAAVIAAAIGMPEATARKGAAWSWSGEPFGEGIFGDYAGELAIKAHSVKLMPQVTAREFRSTVQFGKDELAFNDIKGVVAGGTLSGHVGFQSGDAGLSTKGKIELSGADSASLLPGSVRPPVSGVLGLSANFEGSGLSPIALVGSLRGAGTIHLASAEFAGLDSSAFDAVTRAVDAGLPVDSSRISDVVRKVLDSGQLTLAEAQGAMQIAAGQIRLSRFSAASPDAKLSILGTLDLTDGALNARLVLAGAQKGSQGRPDIFMALKGPVSDPSRSIDVSALAGWLTLRAVENQAKQLKALQQKTAPPSKPESPPDKQPTAGPNVTTDRRPVEAPAEPPVDPIARIINAPPPEPAKKSPARIAADPAPAKRPAKTPTHRRSAPVARVPLAPALPAPIEIHPLPVPAGASVGFPRP